MIEMKVPYQEFNSIHEAIRPELDEAWKRVVDRGWFILGEEDQAFEKEFAAWCGVKQCVGVGNGLDALRLILLAKGIGPGDEVLVPANTYIASALAVSYVGARPVLVDPDPETALITPEETEKHITEKARAIMVVHLYGRVADMDGFRELAEKYHLFLMEDAAQAHGAIWKGKLPDKDGKAAEDQSEVPKTPRPGALSDAAGFSFYPGKNLGALGDAGAVTTDNADLADRVRALANYGSSQKYRHDYQGVNSRLDELQAAVLRTKLLHLESWVAERRRIAAIYEAGLHNPKIRLLKKDEGNGYHIFPVFTEKRDELQAFLERIGIHTLVHYPIPIHLQKAYAELGYQEGDFPTAERMARTELSIPLYPGMTDDQIQYVLDALNRF